MREYSKELGARTPLDEPGFARWAANYTRYAVPPGAVLEQGKIWFEMDLRGVLPAIHVPTLLLSGRTSLARHADEMESCR